jgi:hypothetical protein
MITSLFCTSPSLYGALTISDPKESASAKKLQAETEETIARLLLTIETKAANCALCQEALSKETIVTLSCNHQFHVSCIAHYFKYGYYCPSCYRSFQPSITVPIAQKDQSLPTKAQIEAFAQACAQESINPNAIDENGDYQLRKAVKKGDINLVKKLLKDRADITVYNLPINLAIEISRDLQAKGLDSTVYDNILAIFALAGCQALGITDPNALLKKIRRYLERA